MASPRFVPAISSMSLGRAWNHAIEPKLAACVRHGFKAIELFYEDLEYVARALPKAYRSNTPGTSYAKSTEWDEQRLSAASYIRHLCDINKLEILCIQPFMHYEGLLDRSEHETRIRELKLWFLLAKRLRTDLIQIPSNFLPPSQCTGDRRMIVQDLREAADLGAQCKPPIRFAYEALCWGTHVNLWEQAWEVVQMVDRPNFGTVIDSFNLAGGAYGDPTQESGRAHGCGETFRRSMAKLRQEMDLSKLFYVELVDAERLDSPLVSGHPWHQSDQDARMSWSRNARLFPFEEKGYLPILEVFDVLCEIGYEGYISFELFSRTMNEPHESVPEEHATRGEASWKKLLKHVETEDMSNNDIDSTNTV